MYEQTGDSAQVEAEAQPEGQADGTPEYSLIDLMQMDNIVSVLDEDALNKIGLDVIRNYESDKGSRAHREDKIEAAMNLALQIIKKKDFPWPNASNVCLPLITSAAMEFASRAYPAIIDDNQVAKGLALGDDTGLFRPVKGVDGKPIPDPNDQSKPAMEMVVKPGAKLERAHRIASHISYQFTEEEENWEEDTDQLLHMLPIVGCLFRKRYWDPMEKRSRSEIVFPQRLIVNYGTKSLSDAPVVSEEIELFPYEIQERIRSDAFIEFDYGLSNTKSEPISDRERTDEAGEAGADKENNPHLFIQQLCRIDLDDDGYPEPYIATVHKGTAKVCRLEANFREDRILTNVKGEIYKITPETYYVKYGFIPAFDGGFYDLGFGELLLGLNQSANTAINQMFDAGTMQNAGGGFIGKGLKLKGGAISIRPSEYKVVDSTGQKIAENVFQFQHQGPSLVLFQLLGLLIEMAKDIAGNKEVLAGEQVSNQAGITAMAHIEQGLTKFKAIYKRLHRAIKKELKIQFRLNSINLSDIEYQAFTDGMPHKVSEDYRMGDADVVPVSDPNSITSMQKMARAQVLDSYKDDPYVDPMECRRRIFSALGIEDQEKLLRQPQPQVDPAAEMLMVTAQAEMLKAKSMMFKAQMQAYKDDFEQQKGIFEAGITTEKTKAEIGEIISRIIKNIADAEAAEAGTQIQAYQAKQKEITPK
jgi:chaperonin GroES